MSDTIIFIDSRVDTPQSIASLYDNSVDIFILDPQHDGIRQIAEKLQTQSGYSSIQVFSHGAPGSLHIGSTELNLSLLDSYAAELAVIGAALEEDGDLLLYGCNVGKGEDGQAFVEKLAEMTGADVAASDDVTGGTAAGGDWELEVERGGIDPDRIIIPFDYPNILGAGNAEGMEFRINTQTNSEFYDVSLTSLDDGGFLVAWTAYDGQYGKDIYQAL